MSLSDSLQQCMHRRRDSDSITQVSRQVDALREREGQKHKTSNSDIAPKSGRSLSIIRAQLATGLVDARHVTTVHETKRFFT
eukprot:4712343-Pleurochrysis_carterae.AAC.1